MSRAPSHGIVSLVANGSSSGAGTPLGGLKGLKEAELEMVALEEDGLRLVRGVHWLLRGPQSSRLTYL